jgi:spore coat protein U-like protein
MTLPRPRISGMHTTVNKLLLTAATTLALVGVSPRLAEAETATSTVAVSGSVNSSCLTPTTANLGFGSYNPLAAAAKTATTTISVVCTYSTPLTVSLSAGTTTGGSIGQRLMVRSGAANTLRYNLYTSSAYSTVWGNGTTGSTVHGTGAGMNTSVAFTVYGQIPANQNVPVGTYNDTITVTIEY